MKKEHLVIRENPQGCHLYKKAKYSMKEKEHLVKEKEEILSLNVRGKLFFSPVQSDPDAVYAKIWKKIERDHPFLIGISPVWKYISIAASIALLIVSVTLLSIYPSYQESLAYLEVSAVPGSKMKVVLPDSSTVWLNSNSTLRYPQHFTEGGRCVELTGEALFEVKPDSWNRFVVSSGGLRVEVLGTKFNIHSSSVTDIIETTLLEGSVALFSPNNRTTVADVILSPDQQALYNKKDGSIEVLHVEASSFTSWPSGILIFEEKALQEIAEILERTFDVKIHIQGESLKTKVLTAKFVHQETLEEILSILQISAKYTYRKIGGEIYISDK